MPDQIRQPLVTPGLLAISTGTLVSAIVVIAPGHDRRLEHVPSGQVT